MQFEANDSDAGQRLDRFLAERMPETSRARIQEWIKAGRVEVNHAAARSSRHVEAGDSITVDPAPPKPLHAFAQEIPLDILYEDDDVAAINKPAGMTVHAGAGVTDGTLVNALLHHFGALSGVGGELRPGIVHRLDRYTSGVLLVAKNDAAHRRLARQFESRKVRKTYWAVVEGQVSGTEIAAGRLAGRGIHPRRVEQDGYWWTRLEMPIRRDPHHRVRMTAKVRPEFMRYPGDRFAPDEPETSEGRSAQTDFRVLKAWDKFSFLEVRIATGRTHQIRVHLSAIGHPVVGDRLYGAAALPAAEDVKSARQSARGRVEDQRRNNSAGQQDSLEDAAGSASGRFFLHARSIEFEQPASREPLVVEAPLPPDFERLIASLGV